MHMDELKPCPFCGSLNVDHAAPAIDAPPHPECLDCGASARDLRTWNRRAALEAEQPVAVEPEPVAWMYQFKTKAPVLMVEKRNWAETHSEWTETPLYAHPTVSALVNAQADADVVERWQPIETAPRDGTPVDLWGVNHLHPRKTGRRATDVTWGRVRDWLGNERDDWQHGQGDDFEPTHWCPVPAAPLSSLRPAEVGSATKSSGGDHG